MKDAEMTGEVAIEAETEEEVIEEEEIEEVAIEVMIEEEGIAGGRRMKGIGVE